NSLGDHIGAVLSSAFSIHNSINIQIASIHTVQYYIQFISLNNQKHHKQLVISIVTTQTYTIHILHSYLLSELLDISKQSR
ncbi:hypothetical protein LINPERHAP1_LOCUS19114, partial [Linum perenne]